MNRRVIIEMIVVIGLSLFTTFITSSGLISQYLNRPKEGHVFIGVSHYWEDYFYYLDQFEQGRSGRWTTLNKFSTEKFPPTLFYLNHILLGKIGGLLGLLPFESYNISLLLLKFMFILLSYGCIALVFQKQQILRITSFLLFLFSSSFPVLSNIDNHWKLSGIPATRTGAPMMERFGNIPNTIMIDITFILSFVLLYLIIFSRFFSRVHRLYQLLFIIVCVITVSLTTIGDAAKTGVLFSGLGIVICVGIIRNHISLRVFKIIKISVYRIIIGIGLIVSQMLILVYLYHTISRDPVYQYTVNWNIANQSAWSLELLKNPFTYIHSFGLILIPFVFGLIPFMKKYIASPFALLFLFTSIIGFLMYHVPVELIAPVPRFRFLFPGLYIGVSVISVYALHYFAKKIHPSLFILGVVIILVLSMITSLYSLRESTKPLVEPDYHFAYMPNEVYEGLMKLKEFPDSDSIVLGNPTTSMDILIPGFTGKYTYSGHMLTTYNIGEKDDKAAKFFWQTYTQEEARQFLETNSIKYIMITMYDGGWQSISKKYLFLKPIFTNNEIGIYQTYDL